MDLFGLDLGQKNGNFVGVRVRVGSHGNRPIRISQHLSLTPHIVTGLMQALGFVVFCLRFVGWFASSGSQVCNDLYVSFQLPYTSNLTA